MINANVLVVEDDPSHMFLSRANLKARGHRVVHAAETVVDALAYLALAADGEFPDVDRPHIVLTDGNPDPGEYDGAGGALIAEYAHDALPGVVVIGYSVSGDVCGADHNIEKGDIVGLGRLIMELPDPQGQTAG